MSNDARLDIACRYIPYDQWITTHVDPSWKIRVVKQWILSKCTGAPFDPPPSQAPLHVHVTPLRNPRKRGQGSKKTPTDAGDSAGGERPVSPITFAPDPRQRPISPILFAKAGTIGRERRRREPITDDGGPTSGAATPTTISRAGSVLDSEDATEEKDGDKGGYEEDDEWDTAEEFEDDEDDDYLDSPISPISTSPLGGPILPASQKLSSTFTSPRNGKIDLTPAGVYTLIRFSTGQILEDDYLVSWYNLAPHELLELHSHVKKPLSRRPSRVTAPKHSRNASIFSTTTTGGAELPSDIQYLPRLNRTSLSTYILPYFEGWVFALRVVWRNDAISNAFYGSGAGFAGAGFGVVNTESAYGLPTGEGDRRRGKGRPHHEGGDGVGGGAGSHRRTTSVTSLEWRQRWLVVTEGWVKLYRKRDPSLPQDKKPTHDFPLSALMTLRGKEHFERGTQLNAKRNTTGHRVKPHPDNGGGHNPRTTHTSHAQGNSVSRHPRSLSLNRSHSRSRSRTGHHPTHSGSDSQSDNHTPGAIEVDRRGRKRRSGLVGMENMAVQGLARGEGEDDRRIVCMKFQSKSKWVLPKPDPPPSQPEEKKRYASTQAAYGGGGLDGYGMGVTSFVSVGHGGTAKESKLKSKGKGKEKAKEKEEKKVKGRGGFGKDRKLNKRSLENALAMGVGDGYGPYLRESTASGARESSRTFVGSVEKKEKSRAGPTKAGQSKDKEKDNDKVMSLGMGLGLGLGLVTWKEKKPPKVEQTTSRSTFAPSESHATLSTVASRGTYTAPSSSSHANHGDISSGDDGEIDQEEGDPDEEHVGGNWAVVRDDDDSSSGSEVRFARLVPMPPVDSDDSQEETVADGPQILPSIVSDEEDAAGSAPSDKENVPYKPSHPQMDLGGGTDSDGSVALSDPVFAHSEDDCSDDDDSLCMDGLTAEDRKLHRYGYRYGYRYENVRTQGKKDKEEPDVKDAEGTAARVDEHDELQRRRKRKQREREQKEEKNRGEWVILDLGGDLAYSSFLRILHRHFPPPISSSFISGYPTFSSPTPLSTPTPTPTPTPFPSPTSPHSPVSLAPFAWPSSPEDLVGKREIHDPEPPSPLSTSSHSSRFRFEPPQHPAALASLAVRAPQPGHKTFGALPYPEWRMEVVERAQKAGMGDVGRAMRWVLWGCAEQLADDLAEVQSLNKRAETDEGPSKPRGKMKSSALKNRRQSTVSAIGAKPGSIYDSDASEDTGKILMNISDSEGEGSEAEWHGWMADLHRQHQAQAQKEKEAAEVALKHQSEDEDEDGPPKNPAEDQRRYLEERRALEPHGIVTTTTPTDLSVQTTPSATLYSPSSSESLAHRHRARALSFSPVDAGSSITTMSKPPSSLSHQHTPSSSPPDNFSERKYPLPSGASLSHSTSLYASGLRDTFPENSLRRPSMPTLSAEQTFTLEKGNIIAPQASILRSPAASTFTFPAAGPSVSRSPPFSPGLSSSFNVHETTVTSTIPTGSATMPRRASSAGLMNIGSVSGSLGRSSSVLTRSSGLLKKDGYKEAERVREKEREKEKKARDKEEKAREKEEKAREKEEKAREKEKVKDRGKDKGKARPKLSLATPSPAVASTSSQVEHPTHQVKSPKMDSIMRRVRSGSNLRQGELEDDQPTSPTRDGYGGQSGKRRGILVEKIVRGLDSALDFVDGKP